jgi:nucleotide-binding universal stress UspA family protein
MVGARSSTSHGLTPNAGTRAGGTMKVFKRILHATDFSSASRPALARAMALARQNQAPLSIVHALPPTVIPVGGDFGYLPPKTYEAIDQNARQHARKQLAALVKRARKAGVRVTAILLDGAPHEQIPRAVRRTRADLIVIGTHGRTGLSKVLLGSVAERVVRLAPCPVLTVRGR